MTMVEGTATVVVVIYVKILMPPIGYFWEPVVQYQVL